MAGQFSRPSGMGGNTHTNTGLYYIPTGIQELNLQIFVSNSQVHQLIFEKQKHLKTVGN